jgi:hypothetical protein
MDPERRLIPRPAPRPSSPPPPPPTPRARSLTICSSLVGTRAHTQEMLDFCGEKNIVSDVEVGGGQAGTSGGARWRPEPGLAGCGVLAATRSACR